MSIEQIEAFLQESMVLLKKEGAKSDSMAFSMVQCQLLLHIWQKLDAIEDQLIKGNKRTTIYD